MSTKICLILGNGPSLNALDPGLLEALPAFGCNYAPWPVPFYTCIDAEILKNHVEEIYPRAAAAEICYLSEKFEGSSKLYDLPFARLVGHDDGLFAAERFFTGLTAGYVMLKMAFYQGFEKVILYGIDHSPGWPHYTPGYPMSGPPPSAERMRVMEWHYALAAQIFARAGREIVNCSAPSSLDKIFRRVKNVVEFAGI